MEKINFKDVTFLIPVRIDCPERMENLQLTVQFILTWFNTHIMILEADDREQIHISDGITKLFVKDQDPVFHRTRYLNQMTKSVLTPFLAVWDADVIGIPAQIEGGLTLLREKKADMVFPYNKYFYAVPEFIKQLYINKKCQPEFLDKTKEYMHHMHGDWSVGGAFIVNRVSYIEAGMENEHFYGWGPEDSERYVRWDTLGYSISRIEGPLFHLSHPRGFTSRFASDHIEARNRKEFLKVCSMSKKKLISYIDNMSWKPPFSISKR
jgi:hypothetical protein